MQAKNLDPRLVVVEERKAHIFQLFDDGDITALEYHRELSQIVQDEISVRLELEKQNLLNQIKVVALKYKNILGLICAFLLGFLSSPVFYPKIFGYGSAEECMLHVRSKYAAQACMDLYPSKIR